MKRLLLKALVNVFLSLAHGLPIWCLAHSLLLPVTDVDDGYGHGPDKGSGEWNGAIRLQTEAYQRDAIDAGIIGGTLVFTALSLVSVRQYWREP